MESFEGVARRGGFHGALVEFKEVLWFFCSKGLIAFQGITRSFLGFRRIS